MSEMTQLADLIQHRMAACRNGDVVAFLEQVDGLASDHGDLAVRHALAMSLQVSELRRESASVRRSAGETTI